MREAEFFIAALAERGFHLGAVVLNKVLPSWFLDKGATAAAKELCARSADLVSVLGNRPAMLVRLGGDGVDVLASRIGRHLIRRTG